MKTINSISNMIETTVKWKKEGLSIALVPTMGYFHEGHLALMRMARSRVDRLVVSLFVNPSQFGPGEDLDRYPRDLERDSRLAKDQGVDCLFSPSAEEMYLPGLQTWIDVERLSQGLCGASRPGHFRGVATVVAKLFNIIRPDIAVFGQKDFQQLRIIQRMVKDLNMSIDVMAHPIVREFDGLAMSSRNSYLNIEERRSAISLYQALMRAKKMVADGIRSGQDIVQAVRDHILSYAGTKIDYIFLGDPEELQECREVRGKTLLALAVWVGRTRLIDNTLLGQ
ncbi:MAG: pantoate--beta-alanine ligase [Nitrospiraceae bacterium]|nr:pantoate--beta-alanine ligase [Nitrospiraceae bacterium]